MENRVKIDEQLAKFAVGKPFFYYNGGITVCLLCKDGSVIARGVSICSPRDQFLKKIGRAKSLGRALQALWNSENVGEIEPARFDHLPSISVNGQAEEYSYLLWKACDLFDNSENHCYKAWYLPTLTEKEENIIFNGTKDKIKE